MAVNLLKPMRCYRGRLMHVVTPYYRPPWTVNGPWYASICTDSTLFGGPPHPRAAMPSEMWSSHRRRVRRRRGKVIVTVFHDCQECTLAVGGHDEWCDANGCRCGACPCSCLEVAG